MIIGERIKRMVLAMGRATTRKKHSDGVANAVAASVREDVLSEAHSDRLRSLVGAVGDAGNIYFPRDLIGGTCPRIVGDEEQIVWNAAAEACGSERVLVVWQAAGNYIWYLAVSAEDMASHLNSWCPLAAFLPTEKNITKLPVCYTHYGTYFGEDLAILMVVEAEDLRIYRSTPIMIRAKADRTARELGDKTEIINIELSKIGQMTPVPWYSFSLFEDRARRILATVSVLVSLSIAGVSFLVWLSANMAMLSSQHVLANQEIHAQAKSMQLLKEAEDLRSSPLRQQIKDFMQVNDGVLSLDGLLSVYEVKDGKARWRATVPSSTTADRISAMDAKNIESGDQGMIIGNDAEIEYEAAEKRR